MSYRIVVEAPGESRQDRPRPIEGRRYVHTFVVYPEVGSAPFLRVEFGVSGADAVALFRGAAERSVDEPRLAHALGMHGLPRSEAALRDGSYLSMVQERTDGERVVTMDMAGDELEALGRDAAVKQCRYQVEVVGDLFCDCGWAGQGSSTRRRLETSAYLCRGCTLPDSRIICSRLRHAKVTRKESTNECAMVALTADCDLGHPQANNPEKCWLGGHPCWERVVETDAREGVVRLSPLTIHEAIGYLDAVWRNVFEQGLLGRDVLLAGGTLATPCTGSQDFKDKLSAAVDAFDAFDVPGGKSRTLDRMTKHLKRWANDGGVAPEDVVPVEQAIGVLKLVARLRAGFQHGDESARRDFEEAQRVLGIRLPAVSYAEEWSRLVARVAEQLAVVREFLRKHSREAPSAPAPA